MKRSIFLRCFAITVLSVLLVFVSGIYMTYRSSRRLIGERLVTETELAAALLDGNNFSSLDIFHDRGDCRVTVMSLTGEVLYDSDAVGALDNHIDREEVKAALAGQPQPVERYSDTFRCRMAYYAITTPLGSTEQMVILRLSVRSDEVNAYIASTVPFLCIALAVSAAVAAVFAERLSRRTADRVTDIAASLRCVNDGTYLPLHADKSDGELRSVYDEINELNERTLLHLQREANEREKLNTVLSGISQGILALSADHRVLFVNDSARRLFGMAGTQQGDDPCVLIDDAALYARIRDAAVGETLRFTYTKEVRILLVEVIARGGVCREGEPERIVIFSDITAEKELARQKEEFFANASHELKTPMTAMLGLAELILAKDIDESTRRQVARIHKETGRLSALVSDMLKLSRLESLRQEQTTVRVELHTVAQEVLAELSEPMRQKGLRLTLTGQACVMADERRMYELLQNLLSNAVHYNRDGGEVALTLSQDAAAVHITVRDSGIGIAREHLPHVCERFYRVDKSRSKTTGGTGLGLAIVKHICALYEADIHIDSTLGVGTTVHVTLPQPQRTQAM